MFSRFARFARLRYANQEHAVEVPLEGIAETTAAFHAAYEREYTYRLDAPVELVGVHLVALADVGRLTPQPLPRTGSALPRTGSRTVDYATGGVHDAAIYDGTRLEPEMELAGPAVVETRATAVVLHPGNRARVD